MHAVRQKFSINLEVISLVDNPASLFVIFKKDIPNAFSEANSPYKITKVKVKKLELGLLHASDLLYIAEVSYQRVS